MTKPPWIDSHIDYAVTGSRGFIGQYLLKKLMGHTLSLYHNEWGQYKTKSWEYDKIFFLSTYGNMAHHDDCNEMVKANVHDLLDVIMGFGGWLCYMSSSSVTLPVQTPYSRTKRAAEEILQSLPELKSCIVRPYSVTGVGEQKEHLIPTLIRSCMEGEEMPFDPNPVHDFVDVEDVVNGLIELSERQEVGIFEFGKGIAYPNDEVKEIVEEVCGTNANVKNVHGIRQYDTRDWFCKTPFTRNDLFQPRKTLKQSITEMVEAYRRERA